MKSQSIGTNVHLPFLFIFSLKYDSKFIRLQIKKLLLNYDINNGSIYYFHLCLTTFY